MFGVKIQIGNILCVCVPFGIVIAHHRRPGDPEGIEKRNEMTDGIFAEFRPYLIARQRNQVGLGLCNDGTDRIFCKCTLAYVMKISELNIGQIQHLKRLTLFFGNRDDIVSTGSVGTQISVLGVPLTGESVTPAAIAPPTARAAMTITKINTIVFFS